LSSSSGIPQACKHISNGIGHNFVLGGWRGFGFGLLLRLVGEWHSKFREE
jgi:hypothetical protein